MTTCSERRFKGVKLFEILDDRKTANPFWTDQQLLHQEDLWKQYEHWWEERIEKITKEIEDIEKKKLKESYERKMLLNKDIEHLEFFKEVSERGKSDANLMVRRLGGIILDIPKYEDYDED